ncbi:MAG: DUF962 domain-containing protein [Polyangiaceae bacterium]|nr:DUF962 domain-containing protein [Polyangiaceae bacterium]
MYERRIETYEEFWPFYVREHSDPTNRKLHFVGTTGSIVFLTLAVLRRKPTHILHALLAGYGGAWIGHFAFQKNKPATFKYPLWSLYSDFRMYGKILTGQMDEEVRRAMEQAEREAASQAASTQESPAAETRPQDLN